MRILEITGEPIASGGQEMFIINVLRHIDMTDFQIDLLTPYYCDNNVYRRDVEDKGGLLTCFELPFFPGSFRWNIVKPLYKYLKKNHYDVVHIHSGSITVLAFASFVSKVCGIKKIVVHSHSTGINKNLKYKVLKFCSYPFLKFIPTNYCACSVAAGEWKFPISVVRKRLEVIKNGIDLDLFFPNQSMRDVIRKKYCIEGKCLVVGHIGRFSLPKNHFFILQVFEKLKKKNKHCKLMLVGDGELMEHFKSKVAESGIKDDVIFTGRVSNVHDYAQAMDVFMFPSLWEGLGLVGIEAQGVGVPVIASTNVPQEMKLTDDVVYLSLDNVDEWVNKIIEVSTHPRHNNIETIREQGYDIMQTAKRIRDIYLNNYE